MRFTSIVLGISLSLFATSAQAGSCTDTAHCYTYENGVHVLRGNHSAPVSQQALAFQQQQAKLAQKAKELEAVNRLNASIQAQNAEIAALRTQVSQAQAQRTQRARRRTYYGNPAFFGSNGFIGNRFFGGGTVQLPRSRPRRPTHRPYK